MQKFRIYPDRSNSIASGSFQYYNSSQNQLANLWYGGGYYHSNIYRENSISRHLMYFDLSDFQSKLTSKDIMSGNVVSYKLKMFNALPSDVTLRKEFQANPLYKQIAHSFDLIVFPINQNWDEGRGYDLLDQNYIAKSPGQLSVTGYSNWLSATSLTSWMEPGVFLNPTASTSNYGLQHFETGGEDMDIDITDIVKTWLSGGSTNYGIGIAYSRPFELASSDTRYISTFYTQHTNSAFKPFIEATYSQVINDDRSQVVNNRISRLFLYTFSSNTPVNFFSAGTVSIMNSSGLEIYSGLTINQLYKGTYYVDVWMSGVTKGQKFKDIWKGVSFNPPYDQQDITQNFEIKDNYYNNNQRDVNDYVITTYGLDNNAILSNEELLRIYIDTRVNYSNNRPNVDFGLEYKLMMNGKIELIPWTESNAATINGFMKCFIDLDTSWLLNNQNYQIYFRINDLGTHKVLNEKIAFKIVNKFK